MSIQSVTTSFYRSHDPIQHLKIRITLCQLSTPRRPGSKDLDEVASPKLDVSQEPKVATFDWQQKVFSTREVAKYSDPSYHPQHPLEELYKQQLQGLGRYSGAGEEIFTYVDKDCFVDELDLRRTLTTGSYELTPLGERYLKAVQQREKNALYRQAPFEAMCIMATVDGDLGLELASEHVLCSIKSYQNGSYLEMRPGFNKLSVYTRDRDRSVQSFQQQHRYRFTSPQGAVYEYTVENLSETVQKLEADREETILKELHSKEMASRQNLVGEGFSFAPDVGSVRLHVLAELVSAKNFEGHNLYCMYDIHLPHGWSWGRGKRPTSNSVTSCAQVTADVESQDGGPIAFFGHPFEMDVVAREAFDLSWPKVFLHVHSCDMWDRHRLEGYGFVDVPNTPGSHSVTISTWRPEGTIREEMFSYFVGGSVQLEDLRSVGLAAVHDAEHGSTRPVNRYAVKTVAAGAVTFRFHVITQRSTMGQSPSNG
eukprot:GILJ01008017.1.p1 GENE.GILJ01008017.1~~GILJ01008017.1.p1  ORF type:complete len:482 (+),score=52.76 GILJ01008017.1:268-1713(+)